MASITATPVSLTRLLATVKNTKGVPPATLTAKGIICLNPNQMQKTNTDVLDIAMLTNAHCNNKNDNNNNVSLTSSHTVVSVWPLEAVEEGYAALDDLSLTTMHFDPINMPLNMPTFNKTPRRNRSNRARRKSTTPNRTNRTPRNPKATDSISTARDTATRNDEHNDDVLQNNVGEVTNHRIHVTVYKNDIQTARKVHLNPTTKSSLDVVSTPQFIEHLQGSLLNRAVIEGMQVAVSILGTPNILKIQAIDATTKPQSGEQQQHAKPKPFAIASTTLVDVLSPETETPNGNDGPSTKERPLLESVCGLHSEIAQLQDLIQDSLHEDNHTPTLIRQNGKPISTRRRGVLIHGPPGTGKTLLAHAVAQASGAHIELLSAHQLSPTHSGSAVRTVNTLFARAERRSPSIIILDDVDAITPRRDDADTDNVHKKTTAAILAQLDGVHDDAAVCVLATSSRRDAIDAAMRRAGRLDLEIELPVGDTKGRKALLRKLSMDAGTVLSAVDLDRLAEICHGFVNADVHAAWREGVCRAVREGRDVSVEDVTYGVGNTKPSGIRDIAVEVGKTRWHDIGGQEEAKRRLQEVIDMTMKKGRSKVYTKYGLKNAKGVLLFGPPGCAKTLLARAVATESGANFISIKGAEVLSKWVGESEKTVRKVFSKARQARPCVIFFDEVDALASARDEMNTNAHARVMAQLLHEMDGIDTNDNGVIILAATNRPDSLDEAFTRRGRMDVHIHVGLPDSKERESIMRVQGREVPFANDVHVSKLASDEFTAGFSGAEVVALVREAAVQAMQRDLVNAFEVSMQDFQLARQKVSARTPHNLLDYFDRYVQHLVRKGAM